MTKKVIVYSTPVCPWCIKAKDFLKENKIPYEEKNVMEDQDAAKFMIEKTQQRGVPVIQIGDEFIVGFNPDKIKELLGKE